jgi:hypothetical protein
MLTARYRQHEDEHLRYVLNMENWLATDETISEVVSEQDEGITIDNVVVLPGSKSFQFYIGGGEAGAIYGGQFNIETSQGQTKVAIVELMVENY